MWKEKDNWMAWHKYGEILKLNNNEINAKLTWPKGFFYYSFLQMFSGLFFGVCLCALSSSHFTCDISYHFVFFLSNGHIEMKSSFVRVWSPLYIEQWAFSMQAPWNGAQYLELFLTGFGRKTTLEVFTAEIFKLGNYHWNELIITNKHSFQ